MSNLTLQNSAMVFLTLVTVISCTTDHHGKVLHHPSIQEDKNYYDTMNRATKSQEVHRNFSTELMINVTFLSKKFRHEFKRRLNETLYQSADALSNDQMQSGFFVSLYSPSAYLHELENNKVWSVYLSDGSNRVLPKSIKKINSKERWSHFFPYITSWSVEYLILFDITPEAISPSDKMLENPDNMKLFLSNSSNMVQLSW